MYHAKYMSRSYTTAAVTVSSLMENLTSIKVMVALHLHPEKYISIL